MIATGLKKTSILLLALGLAIGCASKPESIDENERLAAEAINGAQATIDEAAALGAQWRDAQVLLDSAKEAYDNGDYIQAIALANQADAMARQSIADYQTPATTTTSQTVSKSSSEVPAYNTYEVMTGDSLWTISGKSSVYGDPYQWPLIYKANKAKITDADLIYAGQVFDIDKNPSGMAVQAAIEHAKTRGAWSVGTVEASDESYLAK